MKLCYNLLIKKSERSKEVSLRNNEKQYSIIYHSNRDRRTDYTMSCTCGYNGEIDYSPYSRKKCSCPKCGNTNIKAEDKYYNCFYKKGLQHFFYEINIDIKEKEIRVNKTNTRTYAELDEDDGYFKAKINRQDFFDFYFNAQDIDSIHYLENEKETKITKTTISAALSHLDMKTIEDDYSISVENTIFQEFYKMSGIKQLSTIVWYLYCFPQYEILYNTYHNLEMFSHLKREHLKKGSSPSKILGLLKNVTKTLIEVAREHPNIFMYIEKIRSFSNQIQKSDIVRKVIQVAGNTDCTMIEKIMELYYLNYDLDRLNEYLTEDIYTFQGIDSPKEGLQLLYDYVHMCQLMEVDFEKYPRSLKLRHDMANKNLKIQISDIEAKEMELILNSKDYKNFEFDDKKEKYIVIAPTSYKDIIEEGQNLHHCVGSYVDYVKKKTTKILFMRFRSEKQKSLVTLEIRDGFLRQYAGSCDRNVTNEEMEFLKKYCKDKDLQISKIHARNDMM